MGFSNVSLAIIFFIPFVAMASHLRKPLTDSTCKETDAATTAPECSNTHDTIIQDYLKAHNEARAKAGVGLGPLKWNYTVAAYARNYAAERAQDCETTHSEGPNGEIAPYGENIAQASYDFTPFEAVKWWVDDEKQFYDYKKNKCRGGPCLHYTQLLWNTSVDLGCAKIQCKGEKGFWMTCNYDPPGNWDGERPF